MAIVSQHMHPPSTIEQAQVEPDSRASTTELRELLCHKQSLAQAAVVYGMPQMLCEELAAEAMELANLVSTA